MTKMENCLYTLCLSISENPATVVDTSTKTVRHKPVPSVYATLEIVASSAHSIPQVSYIGPMYVAIQSYNHDTSSAFTHGPDFD